MREIHPVLWLRQSATGTWLGYYSPPLEDQPMLLTEAYTPEDAVTYSLQRLAALEARDA